MRSTKGCNIKQEKKLFACVRISLKNRAVLDGWISLVALDIHLLIERNIAILTSSASIKLTFHNSLEGIHEVVMTIMFVY